jgi:hypothetical protein
MLNKNTRWLENVPPIEAAYAIIKKLSLESHGAQ